MKLTCNMRQLSQILRGSYEDGEYYGKEVINEKLVEFKEVRCKRQGAKVEDSHEEFKEIAKGALQFEMSFFERKLDEVEVKKVPDEKDAVSEHLAKITKIKSKIACIASLMIFVEDNFSSGQRSAK